uniref:Ig-like domain-containing protein n=1 Tax=Xiphophorus couchianus TaxID=32473 RepID=A0A3B5L5W7_9TELE
MNSRFLVISCFSSTGASLGDQVRQTPFDILAKRGEAASISCSHSIQNYNVILWYKRLEDTQLQLLGYRFLGESFIETGVDVEMQGSADRDQTCTLMIKELIESSSGVYFCAASYHSAAQFISKETDRPHYLPPFMKLNEPKKAQMTSWLYFFAADRRE